jgi:hypothetical protein
MPKTTKRRVSPGACHLAARPVTGLFQPLFCFIPPFRSKFMNYVNRDEEICLNVNFSM